MQFSTLSKTEWMNTVTPDTGLFFRFNYPFIGGKHALVPLTLIGRVHALVPLIADWIMAIKIMQETHHTHANIGANIHKITLDKRGGVVLH